MKRKTTYCPALLLLSCLLSILLLTACSTVQVPDGYDAKSYKLSLKALQLADDYLEGKTDAKAAAEQMTSYKEELDAIQLEGKSTEAVYHALSKLSVECLSENLTAIANGTGSNSNDILLDRNVLASYLQEETKEVTSAEAE